MYYRNNYRIWSMQNIWFVWSMKNIGSVHTHEKSFGLFELHSSVIERQIKPCNIAAMTSKCCACQHSDVLGVRLSGTPENLKKVTLDVSRFEFFTRASQRNGNPVETLFYAGIPSRRVARGIFVRHLNSKFTSYVCLTNKISHLCIWVTILSFFEKKDNRLTCLRPQTLFLVNKEEPKWYLNIFKRSA